MAANRVIRDLSDSPAAWALDLHLPEGDGPFPALIWIHGGGWHSGTKDIDFAEPYLRAGFALASIATGSPVAGVVSRHH